MSKRLRIAGVAAIGILVIAALILGASYALSTPRHFVAIGTPIQQDDFIYVVTGVGRAPQISNSAATAKAAGIFYIVTIRVDNDAKRVAFTWDERIPRIVDAGGERFDRSQTGQAALDAGSKPLFIIQPGQSASFQAVFDVPANIQRPVLAFDNGILMGDVFDFAAYRRVGVNLY